MKSLKFICSVMFVLIAVTIPTSASTVNLYASGVDDQIAINDAINAASTGDMIRLNEGTYNLSAPIIVYGKSGITIKGTGASGTILQASSYEAFLGSSPAHMAMIECISAQDIEMYGFSVKGVSTQIQPEDYDNDTSNDDSENGMCLYSCTNVDIHDIKFSQLSLDGIYSDGSNDVTVIDCMFDTCMHDCVQFWDGDNEYVSHCYMHVTSNTGVRIADTTNAVITHCQFDNVMGAYANGGVYLQGTVSNVQIRFNSFENFAPIESICGAIYARPGETTTGDVYTCDNSFSNVAKQINPEALTVVEI